MQSRGQQRVHSQWCSADSNQSWGGLGILDFVLPLHTLGVPCPTLLNPSRWSRLEGVLLLEFSLLILSVLDLMIFLAGSSVRIAPVLRFGLAACSVPRLQELVCSFFRTTVAVSKVGMFFLYTVVIFAWVATTVLDDEEGKDQFGQPVREGFATFGESLYTCFTTLNTATLPDSMVPSYDYSRSYLLLWMPFIFVGAVLLKQVILAGVYNDYSKHAKNFLIEGRRLRKSGVDAAFELLKTPAPAGCNRGEVVRFKDFERLVDVLKPLLEMTVTKEFLRVLFHALDDDSNGVLDKAEFQDRCLRCLQFEFHITERDSCLKQCMKGTAFERTMDALVENGASGTNLGYSCKYPGSWMDLAMNIVIGLNVSWVFTESVMDLNNWEEPRFFMYVDLFFSFVYVLEAALKLSHWSWAEYWYNDDNRFDFVASMVLATVGALFLILQQISVAMLRSANILRLIRVLKAMKHLRFYQRTCVIVTNLLRTCREVLLLNLLVVLLWASAGVQLFGGKLLASNPRLEGKDLGYFSSHYQVFNFNDVPLGMITLFVWTLGDWNDDIAVACLELAEPWTFYKALIWTFLLSYYIASPLLAYNVLSAFSIDVYQKIDEEV
ncbi:Two pore calcium channel protein 1A (Voltage-dependent calcium channel protein TPC1A) (NtTPC1A) [Durusdinium trenchii]|uniref:Two pore calcium channel protein 1A (Voltage-dependent calcium channel protein TPC1A) (NtTPC1A) n=2 Tax=Durusdinium trenchii TaxID=1381693 RepID=A0ABP0LYI3_9DINO